MQDLPTPLNDVFWTWPAQAEQMARACRALFLRVAQDADVGPLEESLKWGQPAWRPARPRTGSTLRMGWDAAQPDRLAIYVDCKTDLAERMRDMYPDLPGNDGRRQIMLDVAAPVPEQALAHLAEMTFGYHRAKRQRA
ncbi:hypothetical protein [Sulfitobacter sp. JB4-11]|uniref:hypothetical protein n=1 Tax=Sulfitobacter rhodophyticola TaxID=3238304 RepID=UPI003516C083